MILKGSINDFKELPRQSNVYFCLSTASFDAFMKIEKERIVSFCNQRTLNQSCSCDLAAEFGDSSMIDRFVGITDTRDDPDVYGKLFCRTKIVNIPDNKPQSNRSPLCSSNCQNHPFSNRCLQPRYPILQYFCSNCEFDQPLHAVRYRL